MDESFELLLKRLSWLQGYFNLFTSPLWLRRYLTRLSLRGNDIKEVGIILFYVIHGMRPQVSFSPSSLFYKFKMGYSYKSCINTSKKKKKYTEMDYDPHFGP